MIAYSRDMLTPGMVMGYSAALNPYGWLTKVKTGWDVGHIEVYAGQGNSVAARWSGVDIYPVREDDSLCVLLEPDSKIDIEAGMRWFYSHAQGKKYDLWGQMAFWRIGGGSADRMWCSEFAAEFLKACRFWAFNSLCPSEKIAPAQFLQTGKFNTRWWKLEAFRARSKYVF